MFSRLFALFVLLAFSLPAFALDEGQAMVQCEAAAELASHYTPPNQPPQFCFTCRDNPALHRFETLVISPNSTCGNSPNQVFGYGVDCSTRTPINFVTGGSAGATQCVVGCQAVCTASITWNDGTKNVTQCQVGDFRYLGPSCRSGTPPPDPAPVGNTGAPPPICGPDSKGENTCLTRHPPDVWCGQAEGKGMICVSDPPNPCAGDPANGYLCNGNPPPDPPPPPDTQPPNQPNIEITNCSGSGSCTTTTVTFTSGGGGGPGGGGGGGGGDGGGDGGGGGDNGGDAGDGGGGQGGSLCPDGSPPINGTCNAIPHQCADGTLPVNGNCSGIPHECADGSQPVGGVCGGDGTCENGQQPVNGQCGVTCQDGTFHADGQCPATYYPCPDGTQPVNGQCPTGACNPQTDPNHCDQGHASGGGTCGVMPACNGDQIGCAVLYQTWATRCSVREALIPATLPTDADYGPNGGAEGSWVEDGGDGDTALDSSGYGFGVGGGSCPSMPSATFMDRTISLDEILPCSALRILAQLILLGAYVQAAYIIGRA